MTLGYGSHRVRAWYCAAFPTVLYIGLGWALTCLSFFQWSGNERFSRARREIESSAWPASVLSGMYFGRTGCDCSSRAHEGAHRTRGSSSSASM